MTAPVLSRTYSTRRDIPLLNTSDAANFSKSYALAWVRSFLGTEATGILSGVRAAGGLWTHVRSSNGVTVSVDPGVNLWTGLAALVGNTNGNAHSWIVLRNATAGYDMCIDLNTTLTGLGWRWVFTKTSAPFSTGTLTAAPISATEWNVGVVAGGLASTVTYLSAPSGGYGQVHYFHFSESGDGEFFGLMNRVGAFCFDGAIMFQKAVNQHVSDTCNAFTSQSNAAGTAGARGSPATAWGDSTAFSGRTFNDSQPISTGGMFKGFFGNGGWIGGSFFKDGPRNEYPAFRLDIANLTVGTAAMRGNLRDMYLIPIEVSRIGEAFPSLGAMTHVVAGDFIVPFVGAPPSL